MAMAGAAGRSGAGCPGAVGDVTTKEIIALCLVALCAVVPLAFVLLVAMLRGYTISLHMARPPAAWRHRRGRGGAD